MNELNEKLAVDDDPETAAFRAKCIEAIKRCNDPDLLESMIVLKRMTEAKSAEIAQLKAELELTKRERDELSQVFSVEGNEIWTSNSFAMSKIGDANSHPSIFQILAHLAGRGE